MSNNNMINPANYYNPFAKYNYVSKTRGVYFPKQNLPVQENTVRELSSNIYSESYDAETDLMMAMHADKNPEDLNGKILGFLNKLFPENN